MLKRLDSRIRLSLAILLGLTLAAFAGPQAQRVESSSSGASDAAEDSSGSFGDGLDGLIGTWNLSGESPYGPLEHKLVVTADGKATYESRGEVSEVTNLEIDGNKVSFEMTIFGGPNSYDVAFEGTFDDDGLTGDILSGGGSFATLKAARE